MNDGRCLNRRDCPPFFVSQGTYTVACPDGRTVSVTREGRSQMSVEHAHQLALCFAKREAERQARCICYNPSNGMPYTNLTCPPPGGPNFQFHPTSKEFQLYNAVLGTYHTIRVEGDAGAEYLVIEPGE